MPNPTEINRRFLYRPSNDTTAPLHVEVNGLFLELAHTLDNMLPEGREKAMALTELQATRMWAHAAIATGGT